MSSSPDSSLVRSSAAEILTFAASAGTAGVDILYEDENLWISQRMLAVLYDVAVPTISEHVKLSMRMVNSLRRQLPGISR